MLSVLLDYLTPVLHPWMILGKLEFVKVESGVCYLFFDAVSRWDYVSWRVEYGVNQCVVVHKGQVEGEGVLIPLNSLLAGEAGHWCCLHPFSLFKDLVGCIMYLGFFTLER